MHLCVTCLLLAFIPLQGLSISAGSTLRRTLATVQPTTLKPVFGQWPTNNPKGNNISFEFESVVPVVDGGKRYIAFLHKLYVSGRSFWEVAQNTSLYCRKGKGEHMSRMVPVGGEEAKTAYKQYMAFHCDWPEHLDDGKDCANVDVWDANTQQVISSTETCQNSELYAKEWTGQQKPWRLAACVGRVWHNEANPTASGLLQLPQWLEYHANHGVDQFIYYMISGQDPRVEAVIRPYEKAGLLSVIYLNQKIGRGDIGTQNLMANDCLYRLKGRAKWMMATIDADEFIGLSKPGDDASTFDSIPDGLDDFESRNGDMHSLMWSHYNFKHPAEVFDKLQVASPDRQRMPAGTLPKYIMKPSKVHATFVHYPTSVVPGSYGVKLAGMGMRHYRNGKHKDGHLSSDPAEAYDHHVDIRQSEISGLEAALQKRYTRPWHKLSRMLANATVPKSFRTEASFENAVESDTSVDAQSSAQVQAQVQEYCKWFHGLKRETRVHPPQMSK